MIHNENIPEQFHFFNNSLVQLEQAEASHETLQDLALTLENHRVVGFRLFSMSDRDAPFDFGFLFFSQEQDPEESMEIGNILMSQISANVPDTFITPPITVTAQQSLSILLQQRGLKYRRLIHASNEQKNVLHFFMFETEAKAVGHA